MVYVNSLSDPATSAGLWDARTMGSMVEIDGLLALALVLVVPLGLSMVRWADPQAERLRGLAARAAPFAGAAGALTLLAPGRFGGDLGAFLAAAWLAVCVVTGISAAAELMRTRPSHLESLLPIAACAYLVVGGVWLVLYQANLRPMDLPVELVVLTSVHFHYAGFAAPILAAQAARWLRALPGKWHGLAAFAGLGVVVSMAMIAVGIGGSPLLELEGSILMAVSLVAVAAGTTLIAFRLPAAPRILLLASSAAVWVAMVLAVQYAFGQYTVSGGLSVRDMARTHGVLNVVFTVGGLLGWRLAAQKTRLVERPAEFEAAPSPPVEPQPLSDNPGRTEDG